MVRAVLRRFGKGGRAQLLAPALLPVERRFTFHFDLFRPIRSNSDREKRKAHSNIRLGSDEVANADWRLTLVFSLAKTAQFGIKGLRYPGLKPEFL